MGKNDKKTTAKTSTAKSSKAAPVTAAGILAPTELWRQTPAEHDYPAAANYLGLIADDHVVDAIVDALRKAPVIHYRANDLLRAARLDLLPLDDEHVKIDLAKVITGEALSPVLIVRGDVLHDYPLTVADGYHRICASYHLSEATYIPCKIVDLPVPEKLA